MTEQDTEDATPRLYVRRYRARSWLWRNGTRQRLRTCGWASTGMYGTLLRWPDGTVRVSGVQTCRSVWSCPVCSARIMSVRAKRIAAAVREWCARGGHVGLMTLTLGHGPNDKLRDLWGALALSWRRSMGAQWQRIAQRVGVAFAGSAGKVARRLPIIRATEPTWGAATGWHPHIHALVFLPPSDRGSADGLLTELFQGVVERWAENVQRAGYHAVAAAQDARLLSGNADVAVGEYLAKSVLGGVGSGISVGMELAAGPGQKAARDQARWTPFGILEALSDGSTDPKLREAWEEWVAGSWGRRQMSISPGLLTYLGLDDDGLEDDSKALDLADEQADDWSPRTSYYVTPAGPPEFVGVLGLETLRRASRSGWLVRAAVAEAPGDPPADRLYEWHRDWTIVEVATAVGWDPCGAYVSPRVLGAGTPLR